MIKISFLALYQLILDVVPCRVSYRNRPTVDDLISLQVKVCEVMLAALEHVELIEVYPGETVSHRMEYLHFIGKYGGRNA